MGYFFILENREVCCYQAALERIMVLTHQLIIGSKSNPKICGWKWWRRNARSLWLKVEDKQEIPGASLNQAFDPGAAFASWNDSFLSDWRNLNPLLPDFVRSLCVLSGEAVRGGANGETTQKTELCSHMSCEWSWLLLLPCVTWRPAAFMKGMRTSGASALLADCLIGSRRWQSRLGCRSGVLNQHLRSSSDFSVFLMCDLSCL